MLVSRSAIGGGMRAECQSAPPPDQSTCRRDLYCRRKDRGQTLMPPSAHLDMTIRPLLAHKVEIEIEAEFEVEAQAA